MKIKKNLWWFGGAVLVFLAIVISIAWFGREKTEDKVKIGVILPGALSEPGWNGAHYEGIRQACEALGAELVVCENVPEYSGKCELAVQELAECGVNAIFLESYNYPDEIGDTIRNYPEIAFYCCSSDIDAVNYTPYFARVYQARYLSGVVAGMKTETGHIGYVAAMDNNEVNRGLNAFALGVRSVNKDAKIHVMYTGSWDDSEKEMYEAETLVKECNADVLAYHQNRPFVVDAAVKLGVDVIGYNIGQVSRSPHMLTSVVSNWNMVYREIIRDYILNKEVGTDYYWIGIEKDAVSLSFYSDTVSSEIRDAVEQTKNQLLNNREVFSGLIYDNTGVVRCNDNEVMRDEILLQKMNWLVEGVEVYADKE